MWLHSLTKEFSFTRFSNTAILSLINICLDLSKHVQCLRNRVSKADDIKIKRNVSVLFFFHFLIFHFLISSLGFLFYLWSLWVNLRLLRVVNSTCLWVIWLKAPVEVFINPVTFVLTLPEVYFLKWLVPPSFSWITSFLNCLHLKENKIRKNMCVRSYNISPDLNFRYLASFIVDSCKI